jgi:CubicO group peptidase (beta-lactamase class C family)
MKELIELLQHPIDLPWPTQDWKIAKLDENVNKELLFNSFDDAFSEKETEALGESLACLVIHKGRIVHERYAEGFNKNSTFVSWSMAKSILQALIGILVKENNLDVNAAPNIPEWSAEDDARKKITLDQMLRMVDGLDFNEDYVDDQVSNVIEMLFDETNSKDMGAYAIARKLKHKPGKLWNYSSGTSNIVSRVVADVLKDSGREYPEFMQSALFNKLGMQSAEPKFDEAGTFVGSSFVFSTARDFAKFGYLYLRDGVWDGERILPEGWVDYTRTVTPESEAGTYGSHFWLVPGSLGIFSCQGYEGQRIMMVPKLDLVIVRLGKTPIEKAEALNQFMKNIVDAFRSTLPQS